MQCDKTYACNVKFPVKIVYLFENARSDVTVRETAHVDTDFVSQNYSYNIQKSGIIYAVLPAYLCYLKAIEHIT